MDVGVGVDVGGAAGLAVGVDVDGTLATGACLG